MRTLISAVVAILLLGQVATSAVAAEIEISEPWIREAPPHARALAGFMKLKNGSKSPLVLTGASCDGFGSVMLHRTVMEQGMAKMLHQHSITVPAGETLNFEPGGYHLMLMKPQQPVNVGQRYSITLEFEDGSTSQATFAVRKGGSMAMPHSMNH